MPSGWGLDGCIGARMTGTWQQQQRSGGQERGTGAACQTHAAARAHLQIITSPFSHGLDEQPLETCRQERCECGSCSSCAGRYGCCHAHHQPCKRSASFPPGGTNPHLPAAHPPGCSWGFVALSQTQPAARAVPPPPAAAAASPRVEQRRMPATPTERSSCCKGSRPGYCELLQAACGG